jgi:esterase
MTTRAEAYVLIHGAHHGAWVWDSLIEHLHLPAIALDLPGRHDPNVLRGLTVSDCATAVTAEIRSIGLDRVVIVGHSLAGSVAYAVAAQQPDMVVGLGSPA